MSPRSDDAPTLVVLAAGAGSRFGGPKQLARVGSAGETLLEYAAYDAARSGFGRVVLVVRADTEAAFRDRLDRTMARRLDVRYVHQDVCGAVGGPARDRRRHKPWGTGHAVLAVTEAIGGPFACINADDFYGRSSYEALGDHLRGLENGSDLAVVGFPLGGTLTDAGPVSRAHLQIDGGGHLLRIEELLEVWTEDGSIVYRDERGNRRALEGREPVSMNMWGLTPHLLRELRGRFERFTSRHAREGTAEFRLPEVVGELVDEGLFGVRVLSGSERWTGLTYHDDLPRVRSTVRSLVERGEYPENLWS